MGGVAGPALAAAVSETGGGGVLSLYKCPVERVAAVLERIDDLTRRPYGVNFVPEVSSPAVLAGQVEAVLACTRPGVYFTFFGMPEKAVVRRIRAAGREAVVQVGSVVDAREAAAAGADILVAQGSESGGHHLGTLGREALLEAVRAAVPGALVLAAGGIADGRDLARLERLGADGWMCGTLFVATRESRAHPVYKRRVVEATADETVVTDLFDIGWPGRPHRVLRSPVVDRGRSQPASFIGSTQIYGGRYLVPRFSAIVPTEETRGAVEEMAMYCGTSCRGIRAERTVAELMHDLRREYRLELFGEDR